MDKFSIFSNLVSTHPERSRSFNISTRMSGRGKRVTRYALFKSQSSRCSRSDGDEPLLSLYSHHHLPCPLTPPPTTLLCVSSRSITHLRPRSRSVTTMARWASGQRPSLQRGWPRSSTPLPILSIKVTWFTPYPIFRNPNFVSPTDKMLTPVSQKLNAAKKKHFDKCVALF
jgi:hypothetical protein